MRTVIHCFFVLFASGMLNAATLTFNPYFTTEGSPADFAVKIVFSDEPGALPAEIEAIVTLTPGRYVGDIVPLYVDLTSVLKPLPAPPATVAQAITGEHITDWDTATDNIQGGGMSHTFDIGLAIGNVGIGNRQGDIQATSFRFHTAGLELQHIAAVGVRLGSVGFIDGSRELSRKMYGSYGSFAPDDLSAETPEPSTWGLMATALGVLVWRRMSGR